jgi:hypothetical protein
MHLLQQGGQVLHYVHYSLPDTQKVVFAALVADVTAPAAAIAAPVEVAKAILSAPMPRAVVDAPMAVAAVPTAVVKISRAVVGAPVLVAKNAKAVVAKKAKVTKESAPVMADVATPAEVVPAPLPVAKAKAPKTNMPGPFYPSGVVVEIVGTEMGDRGRSCEEQPNNCGKVLAGNVVACLCKVHIVVEGQEETAIEAYWISDGINRCHVGFLPCHMVKHAMHYNGSLAQVTHVFSTDLMCSNSAECHMFHKNRGGCLAAIIAWRSK